MHYEFSLKHQFMFSYIIKILFRYWLKMEGPPAIAHGLQLIHFVNCPHCEKHSVILPDLKY